MHGAEIEVRQPRVAACIKKNIAGLECPMSDATLMGVVESLANLRKNGQDIVQGYSKRSLVLNAFLQGATGCVLGDEIGDVIIEASGQDGKQVGVTQILESCHLLQKFVQALWRIDVSCVKDLAGHKLSMRSNAFT